MITVHGFSPSGNCHKVRLLLEQLGRDYRWIETDSARGASDFDVGRSRASYAIVVVYEAWHPDPVQGVVSEIMFPFLS